MQAEDDYVMIYHLNGKALKQQTMKYYEGNLPDNDFVRIHRSFLASIEHIARIEPYGKDTYIAVMKEGERLPVSRTGYKKLKEKISFWTHRFNLFSLGHLPLYVIHGLYLFIHILGTGS